MRGAAMYRGNMRWFWLVSLVPLLVGCVSTEFHPRYAAARPQVTKTAVQFYEGDIPAVQDAGGDIIGTMSTEGGTVVSYEALARKAASEGAERGGTHYILTHKGVRIQHGSGSAFADSLRAIDCNQNGNSCETSQSEHPTSEFLVVRVEPEHWGELPAALRPQGLAKR